VDDVEDDLRVVDTDLAIDFLRDRGPGAQLVQEWLERDVARFSAVTAFELRLGADFTHRAERIDRLLVARTLPLDHAAALIAGEVYVRLRGLGLEIGVNDSLLAGTCLRYDLSLATRNTRHFTRVEGLRLIP
jgi:tRNA(fMet)-specific endonuclease VapC